MKSSEARLFQSNVSNQGKRAFFVILFLAMFTSIFFPARALFTWLDLKIVDIFFTLRSELSSSRKAHPAMVITKDQTFYERFGRDPNRQDFATLLKTLNDGQVKLAAFDFIFDAPTEEPENDKKFEEAIRNFPNTVLAQHYLTRGQQTFEKFNFIDTDSTRPPWPLPIFKDFDKASTIKGMINVSPDFDSTVRYMPLAFHPDETSEFLPSLGFAAYIVWLFENSSGQLSKIVARQQPASAESLLASVSAQAPFPFNSTGHKDLDLMILSMERKLIKRHLEKTFPELQSELARLPKQPAEGTKKSWLKLPRQTLPIIGSYDQPCLRLNFEKTPAPVKSDGIERVPLGTLLKTEQDLLNAARINKADFTVDENTPETFDTDFNWAKPGKNKITGKIGKIGEENMLPETIRLEMPETGFWKITSPDPNDGFTFAGIPDGFFSIHAVFRNAKGWLRASCSGKIQNGQTLELPVLYPVNKKCKIQLPADKNYESAEFCFFGEAIHLFKTDSKGKLPCRIFPDGYSAIPLNEEIEIAAADNGILLDQSQQPVSHEIIAMLPDSEAWNHSFFYRFRNDDVIELPPTLDCRFAIFSASAGSASQKTVELTVFPDSINNLIDLPEITAISSFTRNITFHFPPEAKNIMLLSNTEDVVSVPFGQSVSLKQGDYRIFAESESAPGRFNYLKSLFKNRAVFIGTSLQEDQDLVSTPINFFDQAFPVLPGVHLHANLFSALARSDFLDALFFHSDRCPNFWHILQGLLILPLLYITNLAFSGSGVFWGGISIFSLSLFWTLSAFMLFFNGILLPVFYPLLNFISFGIIRGYYAWEIARRKENETRSTFGRFISSAVVDEILKTPDSLKPGGEKKELTVMFTDLAGFTTISEKLEPEQLTDLMNEYLGEMTNLLFEYNGTLDKYIGDAIMAFWNHPRNQPRHPELAARCAIAMQQKLDQLRKKWIQQGLPEVQVRAGINTSTCMVGFIGSDVQMNFTCLGDGVNLASRLEGANKNYGTLNMIAESVFQRLDPKIFSTRFLDYLAVKGKDQPIKVYELRGYVEDEVPNWLKAHESYRRGIDFYLAKDWKQAISCFNQVLELIPEDQPSQIFIERCRHFEIEPPPEKWDGRFVLKTK